MSTKVPRASVVVAIRDTRDRALLVRYRAAPRIGDPDLGPWDLGPDRELLTLAGRPAPADAAAFAAEFERVAVPSLARGFEADVIGGRYEVDRPDEPPVAAGGDFSPSGILLPQQAREFERIAGEPPLVDFDDAGQPAGDVREVPFDAFAGDLMRRGIAAGTVRVHEVARDGSVTTLPPAEALRVVDYPQMVGQPLSAERAAEVDAVTAQLKDEAARVGRELRLLPLVPGPPDRVVFVLDETRLGDEPGDPWPAIERTLGPDRELLTLAGRPAPADAAAFAAEFERVAVPSLARGFEADVIGGRYEVDRPDEPPVDPGALGLPPSSRKPE